MSDRAELKSVKKEEDILDAMSTIFNEHGQAGTDLALTPEINATFPVESQVLREANINIIPHCEQTRSNAAHCAVMLG